MPIRQEPWPHGTPGLVTLAAADPAAAAEPYANLFGWELETLPDGMVVARVLGRAVAAVVRGDGPAAWAQHLVVEDIWTAMGTARVAGATMSDPVEIPGEGRFVRGTDPAGATTGFWEPVVPDSPVGEVGTLLWSELLVRDLPTATTFYDVAIDLAVVPSPPDEPEPYTMLHTRDGELVGRIGLIPDGYDDVPVHWMPYLQVESVEETMALASLFGVAPVLDATDSDVGRIGIVRGLLGEVCGLLELDAA